MIDVSTGADVDRLLARILSQPKSYSEVILCSPFIDDVTLERIVPLAAVARQAKCGIRIITSECSADRVWNRLAQIGNDQRSTLIVNPRLHAKIYLAVARRSNDTEVIVTSANLTKAGIKSNVELGIRATPCSSSGRRLLIQVRRFVGGLAA